MGVCIKLNCWIFSLCFAARLSHCPSLYGCSSPSAHTAAPFPQQMNYLYLVKDYVVKIFQTVNFRCFGGSSGGPLGVSGDSETGSSRGQCPASVGCFGQPLSGFCESGAFFFFFLLQTKLAQQLILKVTSPVRVESGGWVLPVRSHWLRVSRLSAGFVFGRFHVAVTFSL